MQRWLWGADWTLHLWHHYSSNVGAVTAGQVKHNSSNVGGVTAGQVKHNSSNVGGVTAGQVDTTIVIIIKMIILCHTNHTLPCLLTQKRELRETDGAHRSGYSVRTCRGTSISNDPKHVNTTMLQNSTFCY